MIVPGMSVVRAERMLHGKEASCARALMARESGTRLGCVAGFPCGPDERGASRTRGARAAVVSCGAPEDAAGVRRWIGERLQEAGRRADAAAVRLLGDLAGRDAARLRNAVDRLLLFVDADDTISAAHVREVVGPSAPHATDDWAVARAIEQGAPDRALRELGLALDAGAVPYMVLGQLAWVARTRLAGRAGVTAPRDEGRPPDGPRPEAVGRGAAGALETGWWLTVRPRPQRKRRGGADP